LACKQEGKGEYTNTCKADN